MCILLLDQAASCLVEAGCRPGAIAVLLDEARMAEPFVSTGRLSLNLGQLCRCHAGSGFRLLQRLRSLQANPLRPKARMRGAKVAP